MTEKEANDYLKVWFKARMTIDECLSRKENYNLFTNLNPNWVIDTESKEAKDARARNCQGVVVTSKYTCYDFTTQYVKRQWVYKIKARRESRPHRDILGIDVDMPKLLK